MSTVTLNLTKGGKLDLTKNTPGQAKFTVGLGWDINGGNAASYDLDAMAFHMKDGKLMTSNNAGVPSGICYFGNKSIAGVQLDKDNLTGEGEGDDEKIFIDFSAIPAEVTELMVGVNIYEATSRSQNFGMVRNAFMRVFNDNQEYIKYDLQEDFGTSTGVLVAKFYRKDGEWKVEGIGKGVTGSVEDIANSLA